VEWKCAAVEDLEEALALSDGDRVSWESEIKLKEISIKTAIGYRRGHTAI